MVSKLVVSSLAILVKKIKPLVPVVNRSYLLILCFYTDLHAGKVARLVIMMIKKISVKNVVFLAKHAI